MTTYSQTGFSLISDMSGGFTASSFSAPITLEIVVEDGEGIFNYTLETAGGVNEAPEVDINISGLLNVRIDGSDVLNNDLDASIGTLEWDDGGVSKSSIFLSLDNSITNVDSIFIIGGDPLPSLMDLAAYNLFASTQILSVSGVTSGPFAPATDIPLANFLNVAISEDDFITGSSMDDIIDGGVGDDRIFGGGGNDTISGSDEADNINGQAGNDILNGGEGNDLLNGGEDDDILNGGNGDDILVGLSGINQLFGESGDDELQINGSFLSASGSVFDGGNDIDRLQVTPTGSVPLDLRLYTLANLETLVLLYLSNDGEFQISASQFSSNFDTLRVINSDGANNALTIFMDSEVSLDLSGLAMNFFNSPNFKLIIEGDFDDEVIIGSSLDDQINGMAGDDILNGGDGDDVLDGGGNGAAGDTATYEDAGSGVRAFLSVGGIQNTLGAGRDTLIGIENLIGSDHDDSLYGDGGDNLLEGGDGADRIVAGDGNDTLRGGAGNDILKGRGGDDMLFGDAGDDILFADAGVDALFGGADNDLLYGGSSNDELNGNIGNDRLRGNLNNDILNGGHGDDLLFGGGQNDTLNGGLGDDNLRGENGNDILDGGSGDDVLFGNGLIGGTVGDEDIFVFKTGNEIDRIRDWEDGSDMIDLASYGFATVADALLQFSQVGSSVRFIDGGDILIIEGELLTNITAADILV